MKKFGIKILTTDSGMLKICGVEHLKENSLECNFLSNLNLGELGVGSLGISFFSKIQVVKLLLLIFLV